MVLHCVCVCARAACSFRCRSHYNWSTISAFPRSDFAPVFGSDAGDIRTLFEMFSSQGVMSVWYVKGDRVWMCLVFLLQNVLLQCVLLQTTDCGYAAQQAVPVHQVWTQQDPEQLLPPSHKTAKTSLLDS
jgi:hypothetical protein